MLIFSVASSQTAGLGTWNVLNVKKNFNEKWFAFGELQGRSQKLYNDFFYHEYKGGVGYNVHKSFSIIVAAGQYVTYDPTDNFDSVIQSEFRFWQQFTFTNEINRVEIEHRYRAEQRWINDDYRNRFRYRLNITIPLNKPKVEKGAVFTSIANEIFLTDNPPYFERNRFFAVVGYAFTDLFTLQAGWLNQFDYRLTGNSTKKNYLQTSLLFTLD